MVNYEFERQTSGYMAWWDEQHRFTTGYLEVWSDEAGRARIVWIGLLTGLLHFLAVVFVAHPDLSLSLAVPFAAILGPAGAWGIAIGAVLGALSSGAAPLTVVLLPMATLITAVIGRTLWLQLAYPYRIRPFTAAVAVLPLAVLATTLGTTLFVGGHAALGDVGFGTTLPTLLAMHLSVAIVVAPPFVAIGSQLTDTPISGLTIHPRRWALSVVIVGIATLCWLGATLVLDMLRTDLRANPSLQELMARQLPPVLDRLVLIAGGRWGWILHVAIAILAMAIIIFTIASAGRWHLDIRTRTRIDR